MLVSGMYIPRHFTPEESSQDSGDISEVIPGRLTWHLIPWRFVRSFSFLNGWFVGSMLIFQGVCILTLFVFWQDFTDLNKKTLLNTEVFVIEKGRFLKLKINAWKKNDVWEFDSLLPGGGFKYFWCSRYFGEDSKMFTHFWRSYFSKGVGFNHQLMVVQNLFFCWIYMKKNCPDFVMINMATWSFSSDFSTYPDRNQYPYQGDCSTSPDSRPSP